MASIIPRGRGKWLVRVFLGRDENGEQQFTNRTISGTKQDAKDWAVDRERERDLLGGAAVKALSFEMNGLFDDLVTDYRINGQRVDWCEQKVNKHLRPYFGRMAVGKVRSDTIKAFIRERLAAGAAVGTVNRELALLHRAFTIGAQAEPSKVAKIPRIAQLEENNTRAGFFEDADYRALLRQLPEDLRPVLAFAYHTGCRKGEILSLQWSQVDLQRSVVRLEAGTTKSGEARLIPLVPELLEMLKLQRVKRDTEHPACPWVFYWRDGEPMRDFRDSWANACRAAGLWLGDAKAGKPSKLFHDLRRSGVRNLVRSGVPEKVAMTISGHKTRAVFERYNIVSEADLFEAAEKLHRHLKAVREAENRTAPDSSCTMVAQGQKERGPRPS
jgi:integrase